MPLISLLEAGLYYERGELEQAEKLSSEIAQMAHHFPPEIQFCTLLLYAEIMRVQGKNFSLEPVAAMITGTKARYLSANFNAFTANMHLYNGDEDTANRWLLRSKVEDTLMFYKMYQYFTTARSLMVAGRLPEAKALLDRIIAVSPHYRRPADCIEALTLSSVCLWHMKRQSDSIQTMTSAIIKARELQLVMPIIKEGGDILPILQKILTRLKYGYDADILDRSFLNTLFHGAQVMSRHKGCMIKKSKDKPVKLSPRQLEILDCLDQNLSYREISDKLGIKFTTVNDHVVKLYEKLEVSRAQDAVVKAREMGLVGAQPGKLSI
jgi:LuxR family maltose regulon positive regulatory protein